MHSIFSNHYMSRYMQLQYFLYILSPPSYLGTPAWYTWSWGASRLEKDCPQLDLVKAGFLFLKYCVFKLGGPLCTWQKRLPVDLKSVPSSKSPFLCPLLLLLPIPLAPLFYDYFSPIYPLSNFCFYSNCLAMSNKE